MTFPTNHLTPPIGFLMEYKDIYLFIVFIRFNRNWSNDATGTQALHATHQREK